tara:strand:+ start:1568 stop:1687 length:120 start_codon:yes stop_codon:yes gene_type:complete
MTWREVDANSRRHVTHSTIAVPSISVQAPVSQPSAPSAK